MPAFGFGVNGARPDAAASGDAGAPPGHGPAAGDAPGDGHGCPLCVVNDDLVYFRGEHAVVLWDPMPVSRGHTLIVTRRHVASWFDATSEEQRELYRCIAVARAVIDVRHGPDGYTVGFEIGQAAGQAVPHLHMHVIPRYDGDVPNPLGGIRWVVSRRGAYGDRRSAAAAGP